MRTFKTITGKVLLVGTAHRTLGNVAPAPTVHPGAAVMVLRRGPRVRGPDVHHQGRCAGTDGGGDDGRQRRVFAPSPREVALDLTPRATRYGTAIHESGHAVVAHMLGFRVRRIEMDPGDGLAGRTFHGESPIDPGPRATSTTS
jgi:hypothetical protein